MAAVLAVGHAGVQLVNDGPAASSELHHGVVDLMTTISPRPYMLILNAGLSHMHHPLMVHALDSRPSRHAARASCSATGLGKPALRDEGLQLVHEAGAQLQNALLLHGLQVCLLLRSGRPCQPSSLCKQLHVWTTPASQGGSLPASSTDLLCRTWPHRSCLPGQLTSAGCD